ncbi:Vacuolar fusion protein mon1b [Coelomomyces lativittatus]|nr:Vacuolar fusion protein mon1b [Coelomomyces lativittatus]
MSSSSELSNSQSYSTQHSSSSSETALPLHQSPSSSSSTSELSNSNSNSSHLSLHLDQRTHYFVFADSAKPIFSRYDDASHYMTFFSAFQALLAHEPELRSIHLPSGHVLVFLPQPPLMLVTIHPHPCMAYQSLLRDQLVYLYHFVVFLVSKSQLHHWFQLKPNLDLTQILGTSSLHQLQLLCDLFDQNLSYCFLSIETIPVPSSLRKKFGMALTHGAQLIKNSSTKVTYSLSSFFYFILFFIFYFEP